MLVKQYRKLTLLTWLGICLTALTFAAHAKELPAGTVISAANLDKIYNDTFEGHKIKNLLTKPMEMWIRNYGLTMPLEHSTKIKQDPAWIKATRENAGKASLGPDKRLQGFVAGAPFPLTKVNPNDSDCGWKLAWDYYYASPHLTNSWLATGEVFIIDKNRGIINNFVAQSAVMKWEGRVRGKRQLPGKPHEHAHYLLVLTAPFDVAGIGAFTRQYNDGTDSDGYVYLRSLRRTRRTAGGKTWVDPQPKMDLLNDDNQGLQGYPGWYKNWQCKGKRYVLEATDMPDANYANKKGTIENWVKTDQAPHWNYKNTKWQPRQVFVLQGTPPDYHPYGKKVLYMDAKYPFFYHGEFYDKKGKLWKIWHTRYYPYWNGDCNSKPGLGNFNTLEIDFKAERATYINQTLNAHDCVDPSFMKPDVLKKAASGAMQEKLDKIASAYKNRPPLPQYKKQEKAWIKTHGK